MKHYYYPREMLAVEYSQLVSQLERLQAFAVEHRDDEVRYRATDKRIMATISELARVKRDMEA